MEYRRSQILANTALGAKPIKALAQLTLVDFIEP